MKNSEMIVKGTEVALACAMLTNELVKKMEREGRQPQGPDLREPIVEYLEEQGPLHETLQCLMMAHQAIALLGAIISKRLDPIEMIKDVLGPDVQVHVINMKEALEPPPFPAPAPTPAGVPRILQVPFNPPELVGLVSMATLGQAVMVEVERSGGDGCNPDFPFCCEAHAMLFKQVMAAYRAAENTNWDAVRERLGKVLETAYPGIKLVSIDYMNDEPPEDTTPEWMRRTDL
jgi:hypothetical protein